MLINKYLRQVNPNKTVELDELQIKRTDALPRVVPDKEIREMVGELRKLQTALESIGITVDFRPKSHGKRLIEITKR